MNRATQVGILGGAAALTLTGVGYGQAGNDSNNIDELQARLAQAEAQIAQLKAAGGETWMTEQRAEEIRGLVYDVLADADTRSSLLQGGNAGYDNGFMISDAGGNFTLTMNGLLQVRWLVNNQDDAVDPILGANTDDAWRSGFENTRTQLIFGGNVVNTQWTYRIQGEFDSMGGQFGLLDGYINYDLDNGFAVKMGQFKSPYMRETLVYSGYQLAADRSLMENVFNLGRTQGFILEYAADNDQMKFYGSFNDGRSQTNDKSVAFDTEYSFTFRGEGLFSGNWDQFDDFTSMPGGADGMLLGVAIFFEAQENGTTLANELSTFGLTVDFSWEGDGYNLFGAFSYQNLDNDLPSVNPLSIDSDQFGFLVQGGYFFNDEWEGFGRYEYIDLDSPSLANDQTSILTIGVNRYFSEHNVKWTTDWGWAFDPVEGVMSNLKRGYRQDMANEDGQWVLRTQVQLLF